MMRGTKRNQINNNVLLHCIREHFLHHLWNLEFHGPWSISQEKKNHSIVPREIPPTQTTCLYLHRNIHLAVSVHQRNKTVHFDFPCYLRDVACNYRACKIWRNKSFSRKIKCAYRITDPNTHPWEIYKKRKYKFHTEEAAARACLIANTRSVPKLTSNVSS